MWGKVDRLECRCRWMENPKTLLSRENGVRWMLMRWESVGRWEELGRREAAGLCIGRSKGADLTARVILGFGRSGAKVKTRACRGSCRSRRASARISGSVELAISL